MKKNIAIVTGGDSGEYEISLKSASVVYKHIDKNKYNAYLITLKGKECLYKSENGDIIHVDKNDFSLFFDNRKILFDGVFIVIHGNPGENGKLQAYFDIIGLPYTSCDQTVSALTFDKNFCNRLVSSFGILVPNSVFLNKNEKYSKSEIIDEISLPCFVKPNNGGSSIGMSLVEKIDDLEEAINMAFQEDEGVLIENYIKGRELTCGIFKSDNKLIVLPLAEIISKNKFFDFEAKYNESLTDEIVPANVTENIEIECKNISAFLFKKLNCNGIVRFDYILTENDELVFLEVNTIPGLTEESIVPKMLKEFGLSLNEFFSMLLENMFSKK